MRTISQPIVTNLDVDRYNQLHQMVQFLGTRRDYLVKKESFLEGMCEHHTLLHGKSLRPVAKIVNEFNKAFTMVEYSGGLHG